MNKPVFLNEVVPRAGAGTLLQEIKEYQEATVLREDKECYSGCKETETCTYPSCKSPGNTR